MPEGYSFPADLEGAETAEKWWWCANLHGAWHAYYREDDEPRAIAYLSRIKDVDPGSFGKYDDWVLEDGTISIVSRNVSFIDGGVDGYYLEENSKGCYRWARDTGGEMWPTELSG